MLNKNDKEALIDEMIAENCYSTIGDYVELVRELEAIYKTLPKETSAAFSKISDKLK